jgi:hypothetical protein
MADLQERSTGDMSDAPDRLILRQAVRGTGRSVKKHWLMSLVYAVAPIPVLALVGAIAKGYLGVTLLGTVLFYFAALVLIFLSHLARAPFALLAEHGRQLALIGERMDKISPAQALPMPFSSYEVAEPNIKQQPAEFVPIHRDERSVVIEAQDIDRSNTFALVVPDKNERQHVHRNVGVLMMSVFKFLIATMPIPGLLIFRQVGALGYQRQARL